MVGQVLPEFTKILIDGSKFFFKGIAYARMFASVWKELYQCFCKAADLN